ncbi:MULTISPECIES: hypothetical protein [unclassified Micromonospora]|uniref:hypothetical protein n=1 Tax=unclassified Micromonospora TaxID=2617518 RepID=UPI0033F524FC
MSNIVIAPLGERGEYRLIVNGVDISAAVRADSLRITWENNRPVLGLVLMPESVRTELPDAIVRAVEGLS